MWIRSMSPEPIDGRDDQESLLLLADEQQSIGPVHDAIVIGGGISGVFAVAEAVQQDYKDLLLLEKQHRLGGLWTSLPPWQTVQNDPRDFCMQGFTTSKRVWYPRDVCHMLEEYVRVQALEPYICLGREVLSQEWCEDEEAWVLKVRRTAEDGSTSMEEYRCRKLVLCTGKHATPIMPTVPSDDGSVPVRHSSEVEEFTQFRDKRVVVVGAGASGLDLLINTMKVNEDVKTGSRGHMVHWVVRQPRYFGVTAFKDLLPLTILQLLIGEGALVIISAIINFIIHTVMRRVGLEHWLPDHAFNLEKEQLVPNRPYVVHHADRVNRHVHTEVVEIKNRTVKLSDGTVIRDVDAVLMGTGYKGPEHDPKLGINKMTRFYVKAFPLGKHQGRLFVIGETLLDTTGSTPISVHIVARKFWHIVKEDCLDRVEKELPHRIYDDTRNINHMDMLNILTETSRDFLPFLIWRPRMLAIHLWYRFRYDTRVFYADRVLGHNLSLDD